MRRIGQESLVSYGGLCDREYVGRLGSLQVLPVCWRRREQFILAELLVAYSPDMASLDVIKTNPIRGVQIGTWLKRLYRRRLIVRCGILHRVFSHRQNVDPLRIEQAVRLERAASQTVDAGIVTSDWQRELVVRDYGLPAERVHVVPNYVLTRLLRPLAGVTLEHDLLFVGREVPQKNLPALLRAVDALGRDGRQVNLALAGGRCNDPTVRELAGSVVPGLASWGRC